MNWFLLHGVERIEFREIPLYVRESNRLVETEIRSAWFKVRDVLHSISGRASLFGPQYTMHTWATGNCAALHSAMGILDTASTRLSILRQSHDKMLEHERFRAEQLQEVQACQGAPPLPDFHPNIPIQQPITKFLVRKPLNIKKEATSSSEAISSGSTRSKDSLRRMVVRSPAHRPAARVGKVKKAKKGPKLVLPLTSTKNEQSVSVAVISQPEVSTLPASPDLTSILTEDVLNLPKSSDRVDPLDVAKIGSPFSNLKISQNEALDSGLPQSTINTVATLGADTVDGFSPVVFRHQEVDIRDFDIYRDSLLSPGDNTTQRVAPPPGATGTWYRVGSRILRETPTPLRTKCTCPDYRRTGWCPCKDAECRIYRKSKGIPLWTGEFEDEEVCSTNSVHTPSNQEKNKENL